MKDTYTIRKEHTKNTIFTVFKSLIIKKDISKISISEIVRLAGINRSTFYAHFVDKYDLAGKFIENEFKLMLERTDYLDNESYAFRYYNVKRIFDYYIEHKKIIMIICNNIGKNMFYSFIEEKAFNNFKKAYVIDGYDGTFDIEFLSSYAAGAYVKALRRWIENDMKESSSSMAKNICDLHCLTITNVIRNSEILE